MRSLYERRLFECAIETTYGTIPGTLAAMEIMGGEPDYTAEEKSREIDRAVFGADPHVHVARIAKLPFEFTVLGAATPGTAAPHSPILRACGLAETLDISVVGSEFTSYAPISSGQESLGGYFYHDDQKIPFAGARGELEFMFNIKEFAKGSADFTASQGTLATAAPAGTDFTAFQDPLPLETETMQVTIDGIAYDAVAFSLKLNNTVGMHEGSETREVSITDRKPGGKIRIYDPGVTVKDFFGLATSHARVPLKLTQTGAAAKNVSLDVPAGQIKYPKWVNIDGIRGLEFDFSALPVAGNDEFDLRFNA